MLDAMGFLGVLFIITALKGMGPMVAIGARDPQIPASAPARQDATYFFLPIIVTSNFVSPNGLGWQCLAFFVGAPDLELPAPETFCIVASKPVPLIGGA